MTRDPPEVVQDRMDPALGVFTEPQYEIGSGRGAPGRPKPQNGMPE